jgi:hypothetical protein
MILVSAKGRCTYACGSVRFAVPDKWVHERDVWLDWTIAPSGHGTPRVFLNERAVPRAMRQAVVAAVLSVVSQLPVEGSAVVSKEVR